MPATPNAWSEPADAYRAADAYGAADVPAAADELPLTEHLRLWAATRGHQRAFSFVQFPDPDSPGRHTTVTWRRLHRRALALAGRLAETVSPGDRAALLLPQGLDYVTAFLGCLYARVIAVPLFPPDLPGHAGRLRAVLADCEPACLLTDTATAPGVAGFAVAHGTSASAPVLCVDQVGEWGTARAEAEAAAVAVAVAPGAGAGRRQAEPLPPEPVDLDDIAYLQYTSGSTRTPAGVMISHRNVVANARQAIAAFGAETLPTTTVGWLPLFHDMGLVLSVAAPVVGGFPSVLMDPVAFLERPARWLRLLGAYPGTVSAAPNFAYDYSVARIRPGELDAVRLDTVRGLINGSEPVRPGTLDRFHLAFAAHGLRPQALCPSYGLAEATVFVAADPFDQAPTTVDCDREALTAGRVAAPGTPSDAVRLVACGSAIGQELRIADPGTGTEAPAGTVGEIWLRGPNTGLGYWKDAARTEAVFAARLTGDDSGPWLRTGDLGALHEGRLLVTGRLKDLLIVDGRNHYPQDVEETVQSALALVRRDRIAVFAVPDADGAAESVVAVAEHRRDLAPDDALRADADRTARAAVSAGHGIRLARLLLVPPGTVPRTSSGKVSRSAARAAYAAGEFTAHSAGGGR